MTLSISRGSLLVASIAAFSIIGACNHQPDDAITTEIQARMFSEPLLKSASVNVATKDGVVTITGQVTDEAARLAAERIASQTKGVKQVIDSTTLTSSQSAAITAQNLTPPAPQPQPKPELPPQLKSKSAPPPPARLRLYPRQHDHHGSHDRLHRFRHRVHRTVFSRLAR